MKATHVAAPGRQVRRLTIPALAAIAAAIVACADVGNDPSAPASVSFSRLPAPSIVLRDTLRDTLGEPVDLRTAVPVYDANGRQIAGFPVSFLVTQDAGRVRWDSVSGYLISTDTTALRQVSVQARAGRLVPPPVALAIVPRMPTSLARADTGVDSLDFGTGALGESTPLQVRLRADTANVAAYYVEFRVLSQPATVENLRFVAVSTADTASMSRFDTTDASGIASRLLRARRVAGTPAGRDTVMVQARFRAGRVVADSVMLPVVIIRR